jgi:chitin disaccharide deacetylase
MEKTMNLKRLYSLILFFVLFLTGLLAQGSDSTETILLIRADDLGMSHGVNLAVRKLAETGLPFSTSVMVACPWYQEAIDILKENPQITPGIHLTLNSEWKYYKWGPVAGQTAVPSLIDEDGYFFPTRDLFYANEPELDEIEIELRSQIERAMRSGVRFRYIDFHMGTARSTPEYFAICEKLADEYGLALSGFMNENYGSGIYAVPVEQKKDSLLSFIDNLQPGEVTLLVSHIIVDTPEMSALEDLNDFGLEEMSKHRQAELDALTSPEFLELIHRKNIKVMSYGQYLDFIDQLK